ncbi:hypothetical protein [Yaniella halotolerans]|uniref:hypothetical protein n=1 Tax=Yaniella halotolerans TaxID=225453 RepID=UPI0003B3355B|nr:hypothetical protein [Yaniella halotolerans]
MSTLSPEMQELQHEALQRQARQRLDEVADMRAAVRAKCRGLSQRAVAEVLVTSQARVHRLLKAAERRKDVNERLPEELILEAFVYDTSRPALVAELKRYPYTFGEDAPYPHEGRTSGTWDQVVSAFMQDLLTEEEFSEVRGAIGG